MSATGSTFLDIRQAQAVASVARTELATAERRLAEAIRAACPGPHDMKRRTGLRMWCDACGLDTNGNAVKS